MPPLLGCRSLMEETKINSVDRSCAMPENTLDTGRYQQRVFAANGRVSSEPITIDCSSAISAGVRKIPAQVFLSLAMPTGDATTADVPSLDFQRLNITSIINPINYNFVRLLHIMLQSPFVNNPVPNMTSSKNVATTTLDISDEAKDSKPNQIPLTSPCPPAPKQPPLDLPPVTETVTVNTIASQEVSSTDSLLLRCENGEEPEPPFSPPSLGRAPT
ncbi:hypothetical protein NP233_g4808 [Leucocoprinus birnbaumii]|uniref:Uncharacterized protein n=1 Tax=Leucocoprinus birnbaumii TaxID=56174 RepID=A0AAD5YRI6_9AGAR|nr:hypothetical protein NP233_g4808 [Leucocoprinus birnbaumii]